MRIAINGFGRIGESVFKIALSKGVKVVAINDIHGPKNTAYLLKYDDVYGKFQGKVSLKGDNLIVNGKKIKVLSQRDPGKLPWKKLKVDVVIEATGAFRHRKEVMKHISSGAKKVIVTATMKDKADITLVPGVNHKQLKKSHKIISIASCTTNAVAPIAQIINDSLDIKKAFITTVHAYTSSQGLVDSYHKSPRRGRGAAENIVPTTTGAATAVVEVIPKLKGKIDGIAIRVPIPDGSLVTLTAEVKKQTGVKKINSLLSKAAKGKYKGIVEYSKDELVSSDILGNPHSAIVDSLMTRSEGGLIQVLVWYDNEWGYSSRVIDVVKMLE